MSRSSLESRRSIALDPIGGKIYGTDRGLGDVWRANLDGSNQLTILSGRGQPDGIAVDPMHGTLYFAEDQFLRRSNLDGTNVELVANIGFCSGIVLDSHHPNLDPAMYWAVEGVDVFRRSDFDAAGEATLQTGAIGTPEAIAVDPAFGRMYWADSESGCIWRANLDGTAAARWIVGLVDPIGLALDLDAGKIYWADAGTSWIEREDLDGTDREVLVSTTLPPTGLALDPSGGSLYWSDDTGIYRATLDGAAPMLVASLPLTGDIEVDPIGQKIYAFDRARSEVRRFDLGGTNEERVVFYAATVDMDMAIDVRGRKLYNAVSIEDLGVIYRFDLDGSDAEQLVLEDPFEIPAIALLQTDPGLLDIEKHGLLTVDGPVRRRPARRLVDGRFGGSFRSPSGRVHPRCVCPGGGHGRRRARSCLGGCDRPLGCGARSPVPRAPGAPSAARPGRVRHHPGSARCGHRRGHRKGGTGHLHRHREP